MASNTPSSGLAARDVEAGRLSGRARSVALSAALPLVATYFADARTWDLHSTPQVGNRSSSADELLSEFLSVVRVRTTLAAGRRLIGILNRIAAQPTFRYTQTTSESVGSIRGQIDLARYSRQRGRTNTPRRYPIRLLKRETATPENILLTYAVHWVRRELGTLPIVELPPKSPERRQAANMESLLRRALGNPSLAGTESQARDVFAKARLDNLIYTVERRINAGHVARPDPYSDLLAWVKHSLDQHPAVQPGDMEWDFYDDRFDTKLFEIWCLDGIAKAIEARIGQKSGPVRTLLRRSEGAIYTWNIGAANISLHFQASLAALSGHSVRWKYESTNKPFQGYPDIAATVSTITGSQLVLIDPKLRQRPDREPVEEIYKILGYFHNAGLSSGVRGAILYYSPHNYRRTTLRDSVHGVLESCGLDPLLAQSQFNDVATLILAATGLDDKALQKIAAATSDDVADPEKTAGAYQDAALAAMRNAIANVPQESLFPTRKVTAANLGEIWNLLSDDAQTMIVTAEYFANMAPNDADHSGPLLGLAAAVELVLRETILDPAIAQYGFKPYKGETLGACITYLARAISGQPDCAPVRVHLETQGLPTQELKALVPVLRSMNKKYRIPAAHAHVVAAPTWSAGRNAILNPTTGALALLVQASGTAAKSRD